METTARGSRPTINITPGHPTRQPTLEDLSTGALDLTPPEFKPKSRYLQRTYTTPEGRRALDQLSDELMTQREFNEPTPFLERMGKASTYLKPRELLISWGSEAAIGAAAGYALLSGDFLEGARQYLIASNVLTIPAAIGIAAAVRRTTAQLAVPSHASETSLVIHLRAMSDPVNGNRTNVLDSIDARLKTFDRPIMSTAVYASIGASLAVVGGAIANLFGADIDYSFVAAAGGAFSLFNYTKELYHGLRYRSKLEQYAAQERTVSQD